MLKNDPGYLFVKLNKRLIKADQSHGESKSTYAKKDCLEQSVDVVDNQHIVFSDPLAVRPKTVTNSQYCSSLIISICFVPFLFEFLIITLEQRKI